MLFNLFGYVWWLISFCSLRFSSAAAGEGLRGDSALGAAGTDEAAVVLGGGTGKMLGNKGKGLVFLWVSRISFEGFRCFSLEILAF